MMEAALEGLERERQPDDRPSLIGVTQLTSTDERQVREDQLIGATVTGVRPSLCELDKRSRTGWCRLFRS